MAADHKTIIESFYKAFQKGDAEAMAALYDEEVQFEDAGFGKLQGAEAGAMWKMLIQRAGSNLIIEFSDVVETEGGGHARWEAHYPFGKNKRKVHNKIRANFEIRDGKIVKHTDHFNFWRWSAQALGPIGYLLGWSPFLKNKVQRSTKQLLQDYMQKNTKSND